MEKKTLTHVYLKKSDVYNITYKWIFFSNCYRQLQTMLIRHANVSQRYHRNKNKMIVLIVLHEHKVNIIYRQHRFCCYNVYTLYFINLSPKGNILNSWVIRIFFMVLDKKRLSLQI